MTKDHRNNGGLLIITEESQVARRILVLCDDKAVVHNVVDDFKPDQHERFEELLGVARMLH